MAIIEEGLSKYNAQLAKLLDLYLSDAIEKSMLLERQESLQTMIASLTARRDELANQLKGRAVTKDEFTTMQSFVANLATRLDVGNYEGDIERMQQVIDMLDVKASLAFEEGQRVLYLTCRLDSASYVVQPIISTSTPATAA